MARIVCVGEGMLELSQRDGRWDLHHGGDTLNTAIHLARLGHDVAYLTALGQDPLSRQLMAGWAAEGLDTDLVCRHPTRQAGLYAITTDDTGERGFTYWREGSAARDLFALVDETMLAGIAQKAALLFFSLISLAILPDEGREALLRLAGDVRAQGGLVAFDGNYRERLWETPESASRWRDRAVTLADIGLPTREDEGLLSGADVADAIAARWASRGCGEVVVKLGADGVRLPDGTVNAPPALVRPVDTSGAGDAFDAGYLAGRLDGASPAEAALLGQRLAGRTIGLAGAIPPRSAYGDCYRELRG